MGTPLHQPQLATWASCGQSCVIEYGTKIFLLCEMLVVDQEKELKNKMLSRFLFLFLFCGG